MSATTKARKSGRKAKLDEKAAKKAEKTGALSASNADRHTLYQLSVQNVEAEIDFVDGEYEAIRGRKARTLREDFAGTCNTSCEWVRRRDDNVAVGLDIDQPTLDWGRDHCLSKLNESQRGRIRQINRDVLSPGDASNVDIVLAMNFSYWIFRTREQMRHYFTTVRESLAPGGVFFLDHYGGSEAMLEQEETKKIEDENGQKFTYVWDQHSFNPITGEMCCKIHFKFADKTKMEDAFVYEWRLWSLPEIRELLYEAGFEHVNVYWEGEDEDGEGNGEYEATMEGEADPAFINYIGAFC